MDSSEYTSEDTLDGTEEYDHSTQEQHLNEDDLFGADWTPHSDAFASSASSAYSTPQLLTPVGSVEFVAPELVQRMRYEIDGYDKVG